MSADIRPSYERPKPASALAGAPFVGMAYLVLVDGRPEFSQTGPADFFWVMVDGRPEISAVATAHDAGIYFRYVGDRFDIRSV